MTRLFVDTSGWYGFLVAKESAHRSLRDLLLDSTHDLVSSNAVFSELITLLVMRGHESVALKFGDRLRSGTTCSLSRVSEPDEDEAWKMLKERRGRGLSFADATSASMMRRLGLHSIVTTDEGFREFGFEILPYEGH